MGTLQTYKEDFWLLLESGFIAANASNEDAALKLFKASALLRPENVMTKVGVGYVHLLKLELQKACQLFEEALKQDSSSDVAKSLLGLAHALTVKEVDQGKRLLQETIKNSKDPSVLKMANTGLDFIDKFIAKSPTPVQGEMKTKSKKNSPKKAP